MYNFDLILYGYISQKEENMTVCGKRKKKGKGKKSKRKKRIKKFLSSKKPKNSFGYFSFW